VGDSVVPLVSVRDLSKAFGGVAALRGASLTLYAGEIHGLVGENGAGKSTLLKTLAGVHRADAGEILLDGEPFEHGSTRRSLEQGIAVIYQEPSLFPHLTLAENVFVGRQLVRRGGDVDWSAMRERARELFTQLGISLDPDRVKPTTPDQIGQSQVDWIAKAMGSGGGEVAILSAAATAENQNTWIKFMKEQFKKYPELKLVDTVYGNDDAATSAEKAAGLLQSHPNLKGIISPTTVGIAAAAKYISGSQYKGKVQVTGLGLPSEMKAYVKDGTVKSFGLWDPGMLGYVGVYAAAIKASGGDLSGGIKAGDKTYTLDQDGVAIIGPPLEFTADNIDQFNF
jgi:ABC-type sugar transport system ATPase subunit